MADGIETTEQNQGTNVPDALGMSDEDFANMDPSAFESMAEADDQEQGNSETDDNGDTNSSHDRMNEGDGSEDFDDEEDADAAAEASDSEEEESDKEDQEDEDDTEETDEQDSEDETDEEDSEKEDDTQDDEAVDYKAEYEKLLSSFKANGHEMSVKNVDEARRLMQMGANYNKKMSALKPSLKTVKMLDKHGLNDESKLGHLIDLTRGDKGAIQKLLKDHGVDPMDLDTDEENDYRPNTYPVDDREVELDEVLDSLQDTPTYNQLVDVLSTKWDDASKQTIANNPSVLEVLNDQMANGVYERVSTEVERLRAFGQLSGVSDIEAYQMTGARMAQEGAFNDLAPQRQEQQASEQPKPETKRPTRRKKPDPKLKQKKRAASSTRTKPASKTPDDFNPLSMSDEEFERQFDSNLL